MGRIGAALGNRELRQRVLMTAGLLAIFRLGYWMQLPGVERRVTNASNWADFAAMLAASDLASGALFGLGIMPYISASIVFQLLSQVIPSLQSLQKEGEQGRRRLNEYTRYATAIVAVGQSLFWIGVIQPGCGAVDRVALAVIMSCGTLILLWIGEQIDAYGIGNGISLLIMSGIVSRLPSGLFSGLLPALEDGVRIGSSTGIELYLAKVAGFLVLLGGVVVLGEVQRRIGVVSAKDVGRKGQFIPLKLNQAGVMPVIFASSVLMIPALGLEYLSRAAELDWLYGISGAITGRGWIGNLIQGGAIIFFCYFWTAVTFRPKEIAESIKDAGVFVPGFRPGARTEAHLEYVMVRLTFVSGIALAMIAILPVMGTGIGAYIGGTGLMIVASVALDVRSRIKSYSSI